MVDKNVSTPLYVQIANELKRDILSNRYGTHGCMETQSQLAERFSVSLITIRKAMEMLEEEELVEIRRGKGTYVRRAPIVDPLQELTGISNIMSSLNIGNEVHVPVFELQETPEWLDEKQRNSWGIRCCLSGESLRSMESWLPVQICIFPESITAPY